MGAGKFLPDEPVIAGIKADFDRYEAERNRVRRATMWRVPLFDGLVLAAVFVLAWFLNFLADPNEQWRSALHVFLYVAGIAALFFAHAQAVKPAKQTQDALRRRIMPMVFGFIEDLAYRNAVTPESFKRLPLELVGSFDRESFDDVVSGRYDGFRFELYEAEFRHKGSEVFKGIVVAFETIAPFPGLLVALRRTNKAVGFFRGLFGERLKEIPSGNAALDEIYEFRSDDVEAAMPLVKGRLSQALEWLGQTWPENPSRVALAGSEGYLLIPLSKNFFELPDASQPLDYKAHVEPMVADMVALLATAALVRKAGEQDQQPAS